MKYSEFIQEIKEIYNDCGWINYLLNDEMAWANELLYSQEYDRSGEDEETYTYIFKLEDGLCRLKLVILFEEQYTEISISQVAEKEIKEIIYEDIGKEIKIVS